MRGFNQYPYLNLQDLNLDYLLNRLKTELTQIEDLENWKVEHEAEYEQLKALYDAVMSGNFPPTIIKAFYSWMSENALDLMGSLIDMVIVNITDDGYLIAYIPEGWDDIIFNTTGLDITIPGMDYGRLVLSYDV